MYINLVSAVYSREISLIGILKKFIKGFDLLLFGSAKHIGFSALKKILVEIKL